MIGVSIVISFMIIGGLNVLIYFKQFGKNIHDEYLWQIEIDFIDEKTDCLDNQFYQATFIYAVILHGISGIFWSFILWSFFHKKLKQA